MSLLLPKKILLPLIILLLLLAFIFTYDASYDDNLTFDDSLGREAALLNDDDGWDTNEEFATKTGGGVVARTKEEQDILSAKEQTIETIPFVKYDTAGDEGRKPWKLNTSKTWD
jgi:hypothetical protein